MAMASDDDDRWMSIALEEACEAALREEVPVGAVVVFQNKVIARAGNSREVSRDPLGHAEIAVIREAAGKLESWRLDACTLYVTLEPCAMCAGALVNARVPRLVFGAEDPKAGFCGSLGNLVQDPRLNHRMEVRGGVRGEESAALLRSFFRRLRGRRTSDPDEI